MLFVTFRTAKQTAVPVVATVPVAWANENTAVARVPAGLPPVENVDTGVLEKRILEEVSSNPVRAVLVAMFMNGAVDV